MSKKYSIKAQKRELSKKSQFYQKEGFVLANLYGGGDSQALILSLKETLKLLAKISESTVFYVGIEGQEEVPVILGEVQKKPVSGQIIHLSLRKINLKEEITAEIGIETTGEFVVPGAVFILAQQEVEARALPTDLPASFVIDLSRFKAIGEQFTYADLEYDRQKITLKMENEHDPIAVVNAVKEEVEEEVVVAEEPVVAGKVAESVVEKPTEKK